MATAQAAPKATQTGRYTAIVTRMQQTLENARDERVRASDPDIILLLDNKADNLRQAIDLFTRAEEVAPTRTQFGSQSARSLRVNLPPMLAEFKFKPILFQKFVYATEEPVEILYLRELIEAGRIEGLREMTPGLQAAISKDGNLIDYYPEEMYEVLGRAGVLKSTIG
jgi:hypothetical protein